MRAVELPPHDEVGALESVLRSVRSDLSTHPTRTTSSTCCFAIRHDCLRRILTYGTEPAYDSLRAIIVQGAVAYPAFFTLWSQEVEPIEQHSIAVWREQTATCHVMDSLQVIERLRFPSNSLDVAAIYFHLAGSNNYSPLGVYTRTFDRPNLAFTIGHEATHLMVNPINGTNWRTYPAARRAIALAAAAGLSADDLEEMLPVLMQVKLPQACGLTPQTRRISETFKSDSVRYRVLKALEDSWPQYRTDRATWPTVIDYFLDRSILALGSGAADSKRPGH